jgi:hypothetical protein
MSCLREPPGNNLPIDRSLSLSLVLSLSKGRAREVGKLFLAASLKWIALLSWKRLKGWEAGRLFSYSLMDNPTAY